MKSKKAKVIFATALMLGGCMLHVNAQQVDGRDFSVDGFAACTGTPGTNYYRADGTTGGAGGKVVYAKNFSQLQAYLQAKDPYIVVVDHDITTGIKCYVDGINTGKLCDKQDGSEGVETTYGERVLIAPNKTLVGVVNPETGKAPLFSHITFVMQCADNIIIRNCRFTMKGVPVLKSGENKIVAWRDGKQVEVGDPDCIGIQADKVSAKSDWGGHIWVDHCEFFNGEAANKDRYDGLLDCKNNVQWMTFSYNLFHDHDKACLFGKGNSDIYDGCRTISFHHNFFNNIQGSRLPQQRGGQMHYYNNYMLNCQDGYRLNDQATGYVEACYFEKTKSPIMSKGEKGLNINKNEGYDLIFTGCSNLVEGYDNQDGAKINSHVSLAKTDWVPTQTDPAYKQKYLDKTVDVPTVVPKYAGAGKIEIYTAYTNTIPSEDINEYANAVKNYSTAPTYDENGNKVTNVPTAISSALAADAATVEYYSLDGTRLSAPCQGMNIVKTVDANGNASVKKVLIGE